MGGSVLCHMAGWSPRWMTRELLYVGFDYPFNALRVKTLYATVPADNTRALKINRRWGFKDVVTLPDVYPDGDMVILGMRREDCRFLGIGPPARVLEEV
jgi:RimJ/RimL family protein N-acetyltransferase